jgi:uncharacterized membrane protein YedE/YeeE
MEIIKNAILEPWPWYVSGPIIAFIMLALTYFGKSFGMSANLRTLCSIGGAGKVADFFKFEWKKEMWNLVVAQGAIVGGFVAQFYMKKDENIGISDATKTTLEGFGFTNGGESMVPKELFSWEAVQDPKILAILIIAGFLVGFGSRYAGGCTSGHAISGISNLQSASVVAVIGFFTGGLIMIHLLFPLIF